MGRPVVGQHTPRGNALFADLVEAVFELESILCPDRPASRMVAINRRASFLPHKDSGTEALYILISISSELESFHLALPPTCGLLQGLDLGSLRA